MWIDTHCHLDATEFAGEENLNAESAASAGVSCIVIPAVERANFAVVADLAGRHENCRYALGIHPMYVARADEGDIAILRELIPTALLDPLFVAVGEIGLDFFVPELRVGPLRDKQEHFFVEQLKIAREFELPVLLHVRRAQDSVLKFLRRVGVRGGIAHAFNGSMQQAQAYVQLGLKLGFGGAMTFPRSLQIRRLARELPLEAIVLETDAPDIPPVWLHGQRNSPDQLPRIGAELALLRGLTVGDLAQATAANARAVLNRI